jgi:hypothetical protein
MKYKQREQSKKYRTGDMAMIGGRLWVAEVVKADEQGEGTTLDHDWFVTSPYKYIEDGDIHWHLVAWDINNTDHLAQVTPELLIVYLLRRGWIYSVSDFTLWLKTKDIGGVEICPEHAISGNLDSIAQVENRSPQQVFESVMEEIQE